VSFAIKNVFQPDKRYGEVRKINIYLLRLLFILMVTRLGYVSWSYIFTHHGAWEPRVAVAWSVWAAFSVLAIFGVINPLKMLPLVMLEITYKVIWLVVVAYPVWSAGQLAGSPIETETFTFLWVILPIVAMPWGYAFNTYVRNLRQPIK
jgi:hypothetical protein